VEITEVKVKLTESRTDRLQAFCTVTIDNDFVIRDLKIIEGAKGPFVAMPSRKLTDKCGKCGGKNHLRARHCNDCGNRLDENRAGKDDRGRAKLHADIAHPINSSCRERFQKKILEAYQQEVERSKQPGYVPTQLYDDEELVELEEHEEAHHEEPSRPPRVEEPPRPPRPEEPPRPPRVEEPPRPPRPEEPPKPEEEPEKKRTEEDDFSSGIFT
jgi:stage V sporulation protein G